MVVPPINSVRNVPDGVEYLLRRFCPQNETQQARLNSLESLFAGIEAGQKKRSPMAARVGIERESFTVPGLISVSAFLAAEQWQAETAKAG
jgi:hypothetical protein